MTITRLNPVDVRPTISERDFRWLGTVAENDYGEYRGTEYMVARQATDNPANYVRRAGEIMVVRRVAQVFDGKKYEHDQMYRGLPVAPGSYAKLVAAKAKGKGVQRATLRPVDALAVHPLMRRQAADFVRTAPMSDNFFIAALSKRPPGVMVPAKEQKRGPEAILAVLRGKGVELRLSPDKTAIVPMAERGQPDSIRQLIEQSTRLMLAHLRGSPLRCELKHSEKQAPPAASLLVGGAAACEQHLDGELAP